MQLSLLVLFALTGTSAALECYHGFVPRGRPTELFEQPRLVQCHEHHKCCYTSGSLNGETYRCKTNCPNFGNAKEVYESLPDFSRTYCKIAQHGCAYCRNPHGACEYIMNA